MPDLLTLFFRDLAQIPIIGGRAEYTPLIRRVQRKVAIREQLAGQTDSQTAINAAAKAVQALDIISDRFGQPFLDLEQLAGEVEAFVNTPDQSIPPSLWKTLEGKTNLEDESQRLFVEQGWQCFYLISLLPPDLRQLNTPPDETSNAYIQARLEEAVTAQRRLVEGTLRYVVTHAQVYLGRGLSYLDLVQEGVLGLWRATETYKEYTGTHFQHYAATWIQQRIQRAIAEQASLIRIPIHRYEKLRPFKLKIDEFRSRTGRVPLLEELPRTEETNEKSKEDELDDTQVELTSEGLTSESLENDDLVVMNAEDTASQARETKKQAILYEHYHLCYTPPLSLERDRLPNWKKGGKGHPLAWLLPEFSLESSGDLAVLRKILKEALTNKLRDRSEVILQMRYGLDGGEPLTLEAVGEYFGLTRERIRQIESRAFKQLQHRSQHLTNFSDNSECNHGLISTVNELQQYFGRGLAEFDLISHDWDDEICYERARVKKLIAGYVRRGRKGRVADASQTPRKALLAQALAEIGRPAHYRIIFEKLTEQLGCLPSFTVQSAYSALFYGAAFRSYGHGIFGLTDSHTDVVVDPHGARLFAHPPLPLLPAHPHPRAFFESLMVGRDILTKNPNMPAQGFWNAMLEWAQLAHTPEPQSAFDAWYAAGLLNHVDYFQESHHNVQLALSPKLTLSQVRITCLQALCSRIIKMSELLLILDRIAHLSVSVIAQALFQNPNAAPEVSTRLALLASFEAARSEQGAWQLTDVGRAVLATIPQPELPDYAEMESEVESPEPTFEELDDLDWFDL